MKFGRVSGRSFSSTLLRMRSRRSVPAVRSLGLDRRGGLWAGGYGHVSHLVEMTAAGLRFERFPVSADGQMRRNR